MKRVKLEWILRIHTVRHILLYKISDFTSTTSKGGRGEYRRTQMIKGVLELALLDILRERAHYGLEVLQRLNNEGKLDVADGTIYPLMHRMEESGFVVAEWCIEGNRRATRKYYSLTENGNKERDAMRRDWRDLGQMFWRRTGLDVRNVVVS